MSDKKKLTTAAGIPVPDDRVIDGANLLPDIVAGSLPAGKAGPF